VQLVFKFLSMAGELNTGYRTKFNCSWQSETTCMFDVLNSFTRLTDERADRKALTTPCVALHAVLRWKLLWSVAQLDQTAVYVTKLSHIRLLLSLGWRHFLIKPGGATFLPPPPPARQHPSHGDCLEVKRELSELLCAVLVTQCSQSAAHLDVQFLQVQQIGFVALGPIRCA